MKSMLNYLHELFLEDKSPVSHSQYLVMLSMLWFLASIQLFSIFSYTFNSVFISRLGSEAMLEYSALRNINAMFSGFSLPWTFLALCLSFFTVRKLYNIKSYALIGVMALFVFVFFKVIILLPVLLSGNFDQMWASTVSLPDLESKVSFLKKFYMFVCSIGLLIILYPFRNLHNTQQTSESSSLGMTREKFAKIFLVANILLLALGLFISALIKFKVIMSIDKDILLVFLVAFFLIALFLSIYIPWQRLKNAGKSILYILPIIFYLICVGFFAYIAWVSYIEILSVIAPYLISFGVMYTNLFMCYLYLAPEATSQ